MLVDVAKSSDRMVEAPIWKGPSRVRRLPCDARPAGRGAGIPGLSSGPAGFPCEPAGSPAQPAGFPFQPAGFVSQPAGLASQPGIPASQPAGFASEPGGFASQPAGRAPRPSGSASQDRLGASQPASGIVRIPRCGGQAVWHSVSVESAGFEADSHGLGRDRTMTEKPALSEYLVLSPRQCLRAEQRNT